MVDQQIYDDRTQDAVFSLLSNPATYGGNIEVHRCETHAAIVFLSGNRALKVKKAVRFPFLDYSTLEKRKAACRAELEVNRRFAPQLYHRIVPITRESNGELALDGQGEAIEWAVEMTRFDENQTLDHIADRGEFDERMAAKLADIVLAMHNRARSCGGYALAFRHRTNHRPKH
jgi:aminoglycoside phosphotransferase family enzyme